MRETTLGELLAEVGGSIKTGPFGTSLKANEYSIEGVPLISVGEVGYGEFRIDSGTPRVDSKVVDRLPEYVLREGDIVFGRKGAVDRSALVQPSQDGWFLGSDGIRLRLPESVDSRFLAFQIQDASSRNWLLQHATGSTMLSLSQKVLERLPVVLPAPTEQQAIAEVLGALDDKIAANRKLAATADQLAHALFVESSDNPTVCESTFTNLATVAGGGTPRTSVPEYWDGEVRWATPTDVTGLSAPYLRSTGRTISETGLSNCSSKLYPTGSILMTSRATIGAFALTEAPLAVNQGFIVVNATDPGHQLWLFHEMRSRVQEFLSLANGATFLELSRGKFKALTVGLPDPAVVAGFRAQAENLHRSASLADYEAQSLATLRDTLLPRLMSGSLRVRDAEAAASEVL